MKRRQFLSKAVLAAMALPFLTRKAKSNVGLIVAIIILTLAAIIIYQLSKLCRKFLTKPKAPPTDPNGDSVVKTRTTSDSLPSQVIPLNPGVSWFGCIAPADQLAGDFQTPTGSFYYSIMDVVLETSTDLLNWAPLGTVTAWLAEDYLAVQQVAANGATTTNFYQGDWKNGPGIPAFSWQFEPSNQRFFRATPAS